MPQNLTIGVFILGAILLIVGLVGGGFKLFGAEIPGGVSSRNRVIAFILGGLLVAGSLLANRLIAPTPYPSPGKESQNFEPPTAPKPSRPTAVSIHASVRGESTEDDVTVPAGTMVTLTVTANQSLDNWQIYEMGVAANHPFPFTALHSCTEGLTCSYSVAKAGETLTYSAYLGEIGGRIVAHSSRGITVKWLP